MNPVILEGPDFSGKTTLASTLMLSKHAGAPFNRVHFGPPPAGKHGAWYQYVEELGTAGAYRHWAPLYDRFIYGELIYPQVLGRKTSFTWVQARMLERVLLSMNATLVVCLPPWEVVLAGWESRRAWELLTSEPHLRETYDFYGALSDYASLPVLKYDFTKDRVEDLLPEFNTTVSRYPRPGVGSFDTGNILLVGEEVNKASGHYDWPFVSLTGVSPWLSQRFEDVGIDEKELYWINAKDGHGLWTDPAFMEELQPSQVIALGNAAYKWCKLQNIPATKIPHPQAWKRFHHGERYPLLDLLPRVTVP